MKFNRLRLSGFKSFVDPIDLDILPGMTGVVGPNGCGKSNLLEALRWAMGETSYKSMRGSGMEDVIFSGTTARPSRNHAEVGLFLDNSEHTGPAEYNDSEMIEVTRRIERDAGSAYRINGRDVRARDVQLLFADASTGARSTALVRQGQIGELISAKPEARRKILEEAAGISGLHTRRHEAELRLRAAEGNLEKVDDAIGQMESELRSLRRQARQASRYRSLSGQIRQTEALGLHLRWDAIVDQLEQIKAELSSAQAQVVERTRLAGEASTEQAEAQSTLPDLREKEAIAAAGLRRLTLERETLDAEEARAREMIARIEKQISEARADQLREQSLFDDANTQLKLLREEAESLSAEASENEAEAEAKAKQSMQDASESLQQYEQAFDQATKELAEREARQQAIQQQIQSLEARTNRINQQIEERQNQAQELEAKRQPASISEALMQRKQDDEARVETATQNLEDMNRKLSEAEERVEAMVAPLREAQALVERLVGERAALSALFARPEGKSFPSLVDALRVKKGYEVALGAALGDDLEASSDTDAPAHWRQIPGADDSGSASLPDGVDALADFVTGSDVLLRRLSQIGVVETNEQGRALQAKLLQGQRLISLQGDLWRWDGYSIAADAPTAAAQRLSQRNRLSELGGELEAAETHAEDMDRNMQSARETLREIGESVKTARQVLDQSRREHNELREKISQAERGEADFQARFSSVQEALQSLNADLAEINESLSRVQTENIELEAAPNLNLALDASRQNVADGRAKLSEARAAFEQLRSQRQARENRLARIRDESQSWERRVAASQTQIDSLGVRLEELGDEQAKIKNLPEEINSRKSSLVELIVDAESKRKAEADHLAEAEARLSKADTAARKTQSDLSEAREHYARIEANQENMVEREAEAAQKIRETLQVEPAQALAIAELEEGKIVAAVDVVEAKLEKLRRERENLGGVNLRADEEADEIEASLVEMKSERDDLAQAINKLRYGIGQLNREGRERLLAAFESVNEHFGKLFTKLFGGGSAKLELTESTDPLEAGLEIIVHPPGKKPQLMSLLSGGEQALTAMALIFAVFLTNPSPICVLDEVDAPLDDSNVERYCNMIREIADATGTRFLLITHHALTMARMDRLYGVTMQERGVSTLISVDLQQAEQFAEAGLVSSEETSTENKIKA
jgi:chromosome segregation protein